MRSILKKLLNSELWKASIVFSIGWILFFFVLNLIQNNGYFTLTMESVAIIFLFAVGYNLVVSFIIPGRYR